MSGLSPISTASGSVMSKLIPTVCRSDTFQCTEPLRTFLALPLHTGTVAAFPALTGWMVQPSQPCTVRVSDVVLAARADGAAPWRPGDEAPAGTAAAAAITVTTSAATATRPARRGV